MLRVANIVRGRPLRLRLLVVIVVVVLHPIVRTAGMRIQALSRVRHDQLDMSSLPCLGVV